ncbi:hypothetical protein BDV28DRAFT_132030 [Aspergillus coremiiformis]|uniref:Uncharacterized protein n=1 Tax=Aspergillus coremiiformis TaxID=138285 RepID=A0A5N6Z8N4_9EURO|nr:hypothetical protein BDV28DRAFT_132030 [Aspergillus coremiiformis]
MIYPPSIGRISCFTGVLILSFLIIYISLYLIYISITLFPFFPFLELIILCNLPPSTFLPPFPAVPLRKW